jgi:hypothetical protein
LGHYFHHIESNVRQAEVDYTDLLIKRLEIQPSGTLIGNSLKSGCFTGLAIGGHAIAYSVAPHGHEIDHRSVVHDNFGALEKIERFKTIGISIFQ